VSDLMGQNEFNENIYLFYLRIIYQNVYNMTMISSITHFSIANSIHKTIHNTDLSPSQTAQSTGFDKVLFNKYFTNLIHCPIDANGSYSIPNTVINIGIEAFSQCKGLISVNIPPSVKKLECMAFYNCTALTTIRMPESIEEIGYGVFANCTSLTSIYTQASVPITLRNASEVFHKVDKESCILYVPFGSKKRYQKAEQWQEFKDIIEVHASKIDNVLSNHIVL
jgi:hypothetical protein